MLHWCWNAMGIVFIGWTSSKAMPPLHGWQATSRWWVSPAKVSNLWARRPHWNLSCNGAPGRPNLLITAVTVDLSALFSFLLDVTVLKVFFFQWVIGSSLIGYILPAGSVEWCYCWWVGYWSLLKLGPSLLMKSNQYFINETNILAVLANILVHLTQGSCPS